MSKIVGVHRSSSLGSFTSSGASEITDLETSQFLENLGLPEDVLKKFQHERKLSDLYGLYAWQKECLSTDSCLRGRNLILSLPTGAGKTLIAEVLMLRETLLNRKNCILILPFVAIVQEKIASLNLFETCFGIHLEEYAASKGRLPPFKRHKGNSIYICTIEKANILINSLIETNRIDEIGLVIADELHMLSEGNRGSVLEQCLTKVLCVSKSQIIGISATLSNINELAKFLHAEVFSTDFRPVECKQRVKIDGLMYRLDNEGRLFNEVKLPINKMAKKDVDGIVPLLDSIVPQKSVIIFCSSKKNCENLCQTISTLFPSSILDYRLDERRLIVEQMRDENDGRICSVLERGILCGIAYHHSGLTQDERQHIEAAFKCGAICIICATSTLAAGVNLPARRVIIRSPYIGRLPLKKTQYLQMIGRAGRAGFDDKGDSIIMIKNGFEKDMFMRMIQSPLEECRSGLFADSSLESFCLDLIYLKISTTKYELKNVLSHTLCGIQCLNDELVVKVNEIVDQLKMKQMLIENEQGELLITEDGSATFSANFEPATALTIKNDLLKILHNGIVLSSHFHLLYAVVPPEITVNIDWNIFYNEFKSLYESEKVLLAKLGICEKNIMQYITNCGGIQKNQNSEQIYIAFILRQIWSKKTIWEVSQYFGVERGWLQLTLQATCTQAGAIVRFADKINFLWPLKYLLPEMVKTLSICKNQELLPLLNIDCIKWNRAKVLYSHGYKNVASISKAQPGDLINALENKLSMYQARRIINSARSIIRDQIAEKAEELESIGLTSINILSC